MGKNNSEKNEESPVFTMVIDEDRATLLSLFISYTLEGEGFVKPDFMLACLSKGVSFDDLEAFSVELDDKIHERGLCRADECRHEEHAEEEDK